MFDAILADRVVEGSNFALVERTADRFERSMARRSEVAAHAVTRGGGPR
jgi:hypothetical protein